MSLLLGGGVGGELMRGIKNTSTRLCTKNAGGLMREGGHICRTLWYCKLQTREHRTGRLCVTPIEAHILVKIIEPY